MTYFLVVVVKCCWFVSKAGVVGWLKHIERKSSGPQRHKLDLLRLEKDIGRPGVLPIVYLRYKHD
jgi:hypothetical protein